MKAKSPAKPKPAAKPTAKPAPDQKREPNSRARKIRAKFRALAERGNDGEKINAAAMLERLEARYDFSNEPPEAGDIFTMGSVAPMPGHAIHGFDFPANETDIASFARWAVETHYKVPARLKADGWNMAVWFEASRPSMPQIHAITTTIRTQFLSLWHTLCAKAEVEQGDRRPFMQGLYDGMMDDNRAPGQQLPSRTFAMRPRKKTKRKAIALRPALATHPYELALPLGRSIRLSGSLIDNTRALECAVATLEDRKEKAA